MNRPLDHEAAVGRPLVLRARTRDDQYRSRRAQPAPSSPIRCGWQVILVTLLASWLLAGCASYESQPQPASRTGLDISELGGEARWWHVRFRFERAGPNATNSYLDGLLAVEVIAPLLEAREREMDLWRVHRRWPEDAVGHQFSFMFFAPAATAHAVEERLHREPLLRRLADESHLRDWFLEPSPHKDAVVVGSTSDNRWPQTLQREWPHFIMGASRMWLGLLQDASERGYLLGLHGRYRRVEEEINDLWFNEANHALFHHLSALFGYQPMRLTGDREITF